MAETNPPHEVGEKVSGGRRKGGGGQFQSPPWHDTAHIRGSLAPRLGDNSGMSIPQTETAAQIREIALSQARDNMGMSIPQTETWCISGDPLSLGQFSKLGDLETSVPQTKTALIFPGRRQSKSGLSGGH